MTDSGAPQDPFSEFAEGAVFFDEAQLELEHLRSMPTLIEVHARLRSLPDDWVLSLLLADLFREARARMSEEDFGRYLSAPPDSE